MVNCLRGLPRNSVDRLLTAPEMTWKVSKGCKIPTQHQHIWTNTKLLMDLNRINAQVHSSRWNYRYSIGTASVVLELPRQKIGHYLFNEYRLVNCFNTGAIYNKDPVCHGYRERLSSSTEIEKEMWNSSVMTQNWENAVRRSILKKLFNQSNEKSSNILGLWRKLKHIYME